MQQVEELLPGVLHVELRRLSDLRGSFVKTFSRSAMDALGIEFSLFEEFYSVSARDVIRGMHFQMPPHDHVKLVYCSVGAVLDVMVDLRSGPQYGRVVSMELTAQRPTLMIIPRGVAHGFRSLQDGSLMVYKTTTEHAPTHDAGILWSSIDFDWELESPVVSARDQAHPNIADFVTPF